MFRLSKRVVTLYLSAGPYEKLKRVCNMLGVSISILYHNTLPLKATFEGFNFIKQTYKLSINLSMKTKAYEPIEVAAFIGALKITCHKHLC